MLEKELRRLVDERPAGNLRASGDFDEAALHQALQNAIDGDAANRLDVGARNRLPVGNDRQRFKGRRSEPDRFRRGK